MKKFLKRFKGFTLIELLAVIVILAIIAIIAIPIVMNIINESRKNAAVASADGYIRAVNYKIAQEQIDGNIVPLGEYVIGENELDVDAKNKDRITGIYEINEHGVITAGLCIDNYSIEYSSGKAYYKGDANYCGGEYVFTEPNGELLSSICEGESGNTIYQNTTEFKIKTVEDLVCFSQLVNGGKNFSGKKVYLLSNLDINNPGSYKSSTTTKYADVNENETTEGLLTELTTGAGFKPIGNGSKSFSGEFYGYAFTISNLMINRNTQYLGLFGYNAGTISGIKLRDININSTFINSDDAYVGGIAGKNNGTIKNVDVKGTITAKKWYVGGITGQNTASHSVESAIFSGTVDVNDGAYVGGIVGSNSGTVKAVAYNTTVKSGTGNVGIIVGSNNSPNTTGYNYNSTATGSSTTNGITLPSITLEGVDDALDTYIGGDNDRDGYYFDYDSNGDITLLSTERTPIQNKLRGEGTEEKPYIIKNDKDWKMASALGTQSKYFSVINDIDFNNKKFYVFGTNTNRFNGNINGNMHTISNINISGNRYTGILGYNTGTMEGFIIDGINVNAVGTYASAITGFNAGTINGIKIRDININSTFNSDTDAYVGGIAGKNSGAIKNVDVKGTITAKKWYVGGITGQNTASHSVESAIFSGTVDVNDGAYVGGIVGSNSGTVKAVAYNTTVKSGTGNVGIIVGTYNAPNTTGYNYNSTATGSSTTNGITLPSITLEGVDDALDTYIGGDNDRDGYYFDYDSNGDITLFATTLNPIENKLKGSGTQSDPYKISSYNDWKMASALGTQSKYFSVTNDIDFNGKKFYALGTNTNRFNGNINGNMHTISNIDISGNRYTGILGYNTGTMEGFIIDGITVNAVGTYASAITGFNAGTINGIRIRDLNINSTCDSVTDIYVGGIAGKNSGTIKNVDVKGTITAKKWYVGGITGQNTASHSVQSAVFSGTVDVNDGAYVGGIVGSNSGTIKAVAYNTTVKSGTGNVGIIVGTYNSPNTTGYNYNSTATGTYTTNGTKLTSLTLESVKNAINITSSDSDKYYFTLVNNELELVKAN